ncbi:MAG: hypothetical protein KAH56_10015 [Candidatus Krumholzibacteria bacterium]|nr:hypothetical protein [Candidatus Krumholzibacteria bacterium]
MMRKSIPFMAMVLVVAFAIPAFGQASAIDYYGYAWETGGFPPSDVGDVLVFTGVTDYADPVFGVDLGTEEVTFYMYDLVSTGSMDIGGGTLMINYTGGYLEIYRDAGMNADWGISPPNPTSPSTFIDGTLFFKGSFNSMTVFLNPGGDGSYEGSLDGIGGTMIDEVCTGCVYTWGGNFAPASGAQIPDGYDLQVDGVFEIEEAVSTENSNWGSVKALFN